MSDNPFASATNNPFAGTANNDFGSGMGGGDNPFRLDDSVNDTNAFDSSATGPLSDPSVTAFTHDNDMSSAPGGSSWAPTTGFEDNVAAAAPPPAEYVPPPSVLPPWMSGATQGQSSANESSDLMKGKEASFMSKPTSNSFAPNPQSDGLNDRMRALEERERELARREKELSEKQSQMGEALQVVKKNNYPPCFPMTRAHIKDDIQVQNQAMVRIGFIAWHLTELGYIYNWIAVVILRENEKAKSTTNLFMATIVAVAGVPFSFLFWWQALYRAGSLNTTFSYIRFFWHFAFHTAWSIWMFIAIPVVGSFSAGLIDFVLNLVSGELGNSLVCLFNMIIWGLVTALSIVVFRLAFKRWRGQGGQQELQDQVNTFSTVANTLFGPQGQTSTQT